MNVTLYRKDNETLLPRKKNVRSTHAFYGGIKAQRQTHREWALCISKAIYLAWILRCVPITNSSADSIRKTLATQWADLSGFVGLRQNVRSDLDWQLTVV